VYRQQPQQHWSKQHSKVVAPQERLLSIIQFFPRCFVVYIICQWSNKLSKFFTIYHLPVSLHSFHFNTGHCWVRFASSTWNVFWFWNKHNRRFQLLKTDKESDLATYLWSRWIVMSGKNIGTLTLYHTTDLLSREENGKNAKTKNILHKRTL